MQAKSHEYLHRALRDTELAASKSPHDPTPYVVKLYALRVGLLPPHEAEALFTSASAEALRRGPVLYDVCEQLLCARFATGAPYGSLMSAVAYARDAGMQASEGTDEAFLPALAHYVVFATFNDRYAKPAEAQGHLQRPDVIHDLVAATARSFDSPRYVPTHRTLRLLHIAGALFNQLGDVDRARSALARTGNTFDADIWSPFHSMYPAHVLMEAKRKAGIL